MKASIYKSDIKGKVRAPSSKSYTIRGLMCAALARGESEILSPLTAEDTLASVRVLSQVGARVQQQEGSWRVEGGNFHQPDDDLFCGDSAATLRFMTAIGSVIPGRCRLVPGPSLASRPVKPLIQALRQLGVNCSSQGEVAPVTVEGSTLKGGTAELPGHISSQFVSALLLISPLAEEIVKITLATPPESKPFIRMTLDCLQRFGIKVESSKDLRQFEAVTQTYQPAKYEVEGDWSSASYFLALGALSGDVEVENLNLQSRQGDKIIMNFLRDMGASVEKKQNSVIVRKSRLKAIRADLSDCIDLLPTMAVLASVADGVSEFTGIFRARLKESNRVAAVRNGLKRMGIKTAEEKHSLTIIGSTPKGSTIDAKNDHRLAMAFSILGSRAGETTINDAECVAKTYPRFWDELKSIGGEVKTNEQ
jgi:3-phosphoshikimate 1-carboxyvinyltransferase